MREVMQHEIGTMADSKVFFVFLLLSMDLSIVAWNMHGFTSGKHYLRKLALEYDIIAISEHWLFPNQVNKFEEWIPEGYDSMVKCSKDLLPDNCNRHIGHAGVAILWKKSFRSVIVEVDSDRMCCLKIATDKDTDIYVIAVYLPPIGSCIADYSHNLDILHQLTLDLQSKGVVCIIGDLNVQFDVISGRRGDGITPSRYCNITLEMMQGCDLIAADMSDIATGPCYTFLRNGTGTSYIDHCLVSRKLMNHVKSCGIIDEH